ncbi:MAG: PilT/PilU family type 4a pilus ATPase [Gammaproteobacteria bacterium]|nr:PilT/PilU family type 4a pilus ATPase [Gammaproteobacteria bacterium]
MSLFKEYFNIIKDFNSLLNAMILRDASDLFITAELAPSMKINGAIVAIDEDPVTPEQTHQLAYNLMNRQQRKEFEQSFECNFAIAQKDSGRFRVNIFKQKHNIGIVLRRIKTDIPLLEALHMPEKLKEFALAKRGLVIIVGATGSGKSSTLAALMGHRNRNSSGHIITVEDPIEYIHEHDGCVITQREVGVDTKSFESALQNTLRQAPDVILIGEVRARETMEHALTFAETGHLCLTTLHANNANQALDRIINFFPKDRRDQVLLDLSLNLKAIVGQQLIPAKDQGSRRPATEILINTPLVAQLIKQGDVAELKEVMRQSTNEGMTTFDNALFDLYKDGVISYDNALHHADSANEIRLMIKLAEKKEEEAENDSLDGIRLLNIDEI